MTFIEAMKEMMRDSKLEFYNNQYKDIYHRIVNGQLVVRSNSSPTTEAGITDIEAKEQRAEWFLVERTFEIKERDLDNIKIALQESINFIETNNIYPTIYTLGNWHVIKSRVHEQLVTNIAWITQKLKRS